MGLCGNLSPDKSCVFQQPKALKVPQLRVEKVETCWSVTFIQTLGVANGTSKILGLFIRSRNLDNLCEESQSLVYSAFISVSKFRMFGLGDICYPSHYYTQSSTRSLPVPHYLSDVHRGT